jgi:hypothetical protein
MRNNVFRVLVAIAASAACVSLSHAHPVLQLTEQTVTQPPKGSKQTPASKDFPVRVTLGGKYLSVDAQGTRRIYDFEHRRLYELYLDEKTFEEASLYSVLAFNTLELQNRLRLAAILSSAKVQSASQAPALLEHLFSMSVQQDTTIETARIKNATVYRWTDKSLLTVSDKWWPLAPGAQSEYWRFLRYTIGGHPKIYADLQRRTGVPEFIRTLRSDVAEQVVTLRAKSVTNEPDGPFSLDGFARADPAREPYVALKQIGSDAAAGLATRAETAKKDRDAAAAQGKILDAALAHFAYALSSGDSSKDWLLQIRDRMKADPDARAFAASLSASNADQAAKAVKTLGELRARNTSPYAYLLDVFTANHEGSLKHSTAAEKLFLAAVSANPYLTGAWFDLGKLYYGTLRTREAWACWDAARAINPNHPFGKEIDTMERNMAAEHPELF